ncbi:MAG: 16S rRNA processing protein RimM [Desulfobacterales bacterium]|nr:MAG: 16S rRNA processing protein RimM [Desulfobacterales bacterium]
MSVEKKGYVLIGEIIGTHGIKGAHKIRSYAESTEVFEPGRSILVRESSGRETHREINWVNPHKRTPLLSFKGIDDRNQAQLLAGAALFIPKAELPQLENGSFYWIDLIGMEVYTTADEYLGRLESIIETGSNDVYVVQDKKKEVLIPALESVVVDIDLEQKRMRVDLPEGLI